MDSNQLAFDGGAVKALGGGRIEGYGVLHSTVIDPDLQDEFFTKSTEYMLQVGDRRPLLYRHGVHPQMKSRLLGWVTVKSIDDAGVFFDGEMLLSDDYEKAIYRMIEHKKQGFSSGAVSHLVKKELREQGDKKALEITVWPVGELSLTPTPVEPRTRSTVAVKELAAEDQEDFNQIVKALEQEDFDHAFSIDGIPSIKAFCEAVAPTSLADEARTSRATADAAKEFTTIAKLFGEGLFSRATRLVRRTENRFLKQAREIDPSTVKQSKEMLDTLKAIKPAFQSIEEGIEGIIKISEMSVAEQRAVNEKARIAMLNFCRLSGTTPEELEA